MSNQLAVIKNYARSPEIMERFAEVLGNYNAPAYISSVMLAVANNNKLQECTPQSIITSAMRAATLRLSCDPSTGQAWLIPFGKKATFVVGYKGIKDMALRTNKYRFLNVARIYEGQTVNEDQLKGIHTIDGFRNKNSKVIGYLLFFELLSGYSKTFYMTADEIIEHAKKYSKSYGRSDSVWKTNPDAMMAKTVMRLGLTKWGYLDPNDAMVMGAVDEDDLEDETLPDPDDVTIEEKPKRTVKENMDDLGFDDQSTVDAEFEDAPQPEPEAEQTPKGADSKGKKFVEMTIPELAGHLNEYEKRLRENPNDETTLNKRDEAKQVLEQKRINGS